jgi:hypothetical protein
MPRQKKQPLSENTNLEFHVDLCSERYKQMNQKLDNLRKQAEDQKVSNDKKFEKLFEKIDTIYIQIAESKSSQNKMLIAVLVATLTAVIGAFISQM